METYGLSGLATFVAVARCGGFRAAARDLDLSPSAVSHAVAALEAKIGVALLARTTRSVSLTEAGRRLLDQLQPALKDIDDALLTAGESRDRPSGTLRLTAPRSIVPWMLLLRLAAFHAACPDVVVEIKADDALLDIVAEGFDAGLRLGETLQKDMIAIRLGPAQRMACLASRDFMRGREPPKHPRDLVDLPCILTRFPSGSIFRWEFEKGAETIEITPRGPLILNDNRLVLDAVRTGLGVGVALESSAESAIAADGLVRLLEDWSAPFPGFFLYYPSRRRMRPALRAFIDLLARRD